MAPSVKAGRVSWIVNRAAVYDYDGRLTKIEPILTIDYYFRANKASFSSVIGSRVKGQGTSASLFLGLTFLPPAAAAVDCGL